MAGSKKNQCQNFSINIILSLEQSREKNVNQKWSVEQFFGSL